MTRETKGTESGESTQIRRPPRDGNVARWARAVGCKRLRAVEQENRTQEAIGYLLRRPRHLEGFADRMQ